MQWNMLGIIPSIDDVMKYHEKCMRKKAEEQLISLNTKLTAGVKINPFKALLAASGKNRLR